MRLATSKPILGVLLPLVLVLGVAAPASGGPALEDAALVNALKTREISQVAFQDHTLDQLIQWMRTATGFNFLVKRGAIEKAGIDLSAVTFTLQLEKVSVWTLLATLLEPHDLALKIQGNLILVTTKAEAAGKPYTRLYSIAHITWRKYDFIAPSLDLHPSGFVAEDYEPEVVVENDPLSSGDAVVELVKEIVCPEEWGTEGWNIRATDTYLVVRAPKKVHRDMERALAVIASLK